MNKTLKFVLIGVAVILAIIVGIFVVPGPQTSALFSPAQSTPAAEADTPAPVEEQEQEQSEALVDQAAIDAQNAVADAEAAQIAAEAAAAEAKTAQVEAEKAAAEANAITTETKNEYTVKSSAVVWASPEAKVQIGTYQDSEPVTIVMVQETEKGQFVQIKEAEGWISAEDILLNGNPNLYTVAKGAAVWQTAEKKLQIGVYQGEDPVEITAVNEKGDFVQIKDISGWIYSQDILLDGVPLTKEQALQATNKFGAPITGSQAALAPANAAAAAPVAAGNVPQTNSVATQTNGQTEEALAISAEQGPDGTALETMTEGSWEVTYFSGSTEQMRGWFDRIKDPNPGVWKVFPNQPNPDLPDSEWRVVTNAQGKKETPDGLEYGLAESVFMEQNEYGQFPVQAEGYRYISGDYVIPGVDECQAEDGMGCAIALFNVGGTTADVMGWVRQGFTVPGRYFNGDVLHIGMWALASHGSANMLNMATFGAGDDTLNDPNRTNAGANCSVPDGCQKVRFTIIVMSGNQVLVKAVTFVDPTN